ncbi:DUF6456 domain-containing protein [uncultured Brevundimonas sp.]|uniref:DUF6456 domain-containing protein n=1 Tax=uncultured Brevundimonas sp. TaxID=213418 RepID=UPI0030EC6C98
MTGRLERARQLLVRGGAWLDVEGDGYALRLGPDRRARVTLRLDETGFRALVAAPGLRLRHGGGWCARQVAEPAAGPAPGRPGWIEGERTVMQADGRLIRHRANLGESALAWLARRKDPSGRPWLSPAEFAAGERLRAEAERALRGPSLTMRWDALPRAGGGSAARAEPSDHALAAGYRVEAALQACGPRLRGMLERVCVRGLGLQCAEAELGLRRRQGRTLLKDGLQALAAHYGLDRPVAPVSR